MVISQFDRKPKKQTPQLFRPQLATLVILGTVLLMASVSAAWFAGEGTIHQFFAQLEQIQQSPPLWLQVPIEAKSGLLAPTVILWLLVLGIMRVSPQPRSWSRTIVVVILLVLTLRYILWRMFSTLNLSTPLNGTVSLCLFLLEMLMLSTATLQFFLLLRVRDRRRDADGYAVAVLEKTFTPSVAILIPTYNEPNFILRRTVMGCQALDYPHKQIYLLDDTQRSQVRELAAQLGCEYLSRPDNRHAKAGNLNHAIARTESDLIVVFDADFVPTRNFLTRTIGFFQNPAIALVQTPQSFYNPDPIARNLGLENVLTPDEEVFYRQIQPMRDGAGSVTCSGTSFVVRRSPLEATGGFVTESLSEDYFTGIRLSAHGYQLVYLNEKLSAGLAADNMAAHAMQRLRWARGSLQAFFIDTNPLTIPGLNLIQRLAHLEGLLHWFTNLSRAAYLLVPLAYSFLHVIPVRASSAEVVYFFLPYYVVQMSVFAWLNRQARSALFADIYSLVLTLPLALTVIQVMLKPFGKGFQVTPKGTVSDRYSFNWSLALPLIVLFGGTAISLWQNLGISLFPGSWSAEMTAAVPQPIKGTNLGWIWSSYNLVMLGISLLIVLDAPKPDLHDWFDLRRTVRLTFADRALTDRALADQTRWGITTMLSEGGAEVALTQAGLSKQFPRDGSPVTLEMMETDLTLQGSITHIEVKAGFPTVKIQFEAVTLAQHRCLVEMLFCRPGQWQHRKTPGEFQSLLLLLRILLKPRILSDRSIEVRALGVAKS